MFAGLEIVDDRVQKTPAPRVAEALSERMFELGLSTNLLRMGSHERVFRLAPPLVMTDAQIDMGLELMEEALRTTEGTLPLLS
jgi:4-aminobutyrate aminotransferase-like enzyme